MSFLNKYGLINARSVDTVSENTILFTTELLLLKHNEGIKQRLIDFINACKVKDGLYKQNPELFGTHDDYMSHDTLTGLVAFSYKYDLNYHKEIWAYLVKHLFTYDNVSGKINFDRFMHPRDIIYYGYCAGNLICKFLYPILAIIMIVGVLQKYKIRNGNKIIKTDGKLLSWVRCKASNLNLTFKLLTFSLKKFSYFKYWKEVFFYYFAEEEHPIRKFLS